MTKQQLKQIYYTARELNMWERELERLKARSPVSSPQMYNGSSGGTSDPTAQKTERIISLEEKIHRLRDKLQTERDEAVQFVLTIPDSLTRMIVYYRCINLMNWRRVAYEVGGGNTEEGVRKVYERFCAKLPSK